MTTDNRERVAVFVHGDNLFRFQKTSFWVDPQMLLKWTDNNIGKIVDAYYYLSYNPDNEKQMSFIRTLPRLGFKPVAHPLRFFDVDEDEKEHCEDSGLEFEPANLNMYMACDMLLSDSHWDRAIFVMPSDEFTHPMEIARNRGKAITLLASRGFDNEVRNVAGFSYIDLNDLKRCVERVEKRTTEYSRKGA